jgi:hypothetical protein
MTNFILSSGFSVRAAAFKNTGEWIACLDTANRIEFGDIALIGKDTL